MSTPNLPNSVVTWLASREQREHHQFWHLFRNRDVWENQLTEAQRIAIINMGWQAPRFETEPGAGIDFLGMHRQMILNVDAALQSAGDPHYRRVTGWDPIPWDPTDPDYPVPLLDPSTVLPPDDPKSPESMRQMQGFVTGGFHNLAWLATQELDTVGTILEFSIHGWMHNRWADLPHPVPNSLDPENDHLGNFWSSHVNKLFWKLHGWIDECIGYWERATGRDADLSQAWHGPGGHIHPTFPAPVRESLLHHPEMRSTVDALMQIQPGFRTDPAIIERLQTQLDPDTAEIPA